MGLLCFYLYMMKIYSDNFFQITGFFSRLKTGLVALCLLVILDYLTFRIILITYVETVSGTGCF